MPAVAAVLTVNNDAFLDVNEYGDWKLEDAVGLDRVERVGLKHKFHKLQKKCCAKKRKVLMSVAEPFTLANKLLGSVDEHISMTERATGADCGDEHGAGSETDTDEQDGSCKSVGRCSDKSYL